MLEVRDLYQEMLDGKTKYVKDDPWFFAEMNFPKEAFAGLIGLDADGNEDDSKQQNIDSMLNMVEDLGNYTREEWKLFFEKVRVEGI